MKKWFLFWWTGCLLLQAATAQEYLFNSPVFFSSDSILRVVITADIKEIQRHRMVNDYRNAAIAIYQGDILLASEKILLRPRGEYRREMCFPPQLLINFRASASSKLYPLKKLKLVHACEEDDYSNQLILREYLVYKMYNLLTTFSFKVRLVELSFLQPGKSKVSKKRMAFFLEDIDALAERNGSVEESDVRYNSEQTNRSNGTLLSMFQYFIGNTDWAVPLYRNIKLVVPKEAYQKVPMAVPYDFDYCGMVNARYAVPYETLNISSVTQRVYRGFPRTMEELDGVISLMQSKRLNMDALINDCHGLEPYVRREMMEYLASFFHIVADKEKVKQTFIDGARKE